MADASPFPAAEDSDSDDVRWALETASAMWGQGDSKEALRWLKKAADTASEEGDDMRSLTLAKAAADLRGSLEAEGQDLASQAPPPVTTQASAPSASPPASTPPPSSPPLSSPPLSSPPLSSPPPSSPPPSVPAPASAPPTSQPIIVPSSGPDSGDESRPTLVHPRAKFIPAPKNDALEPDDEDQPPPSSVRPSAPAPPSSRGSSSRASARRLPPARKSTPGRRPTTPHYAVRVSVQRVDNQPGAFVARILAPGERPGPNTVEAMLVALDPKAKFD